MFTHPPGVSYEEPTMHMKNTTLEGADTFPQLGNTISKDDTICVEILTCILKAIFPFGKLEGTVWSSKDITMKTKLIVHADCVNIHTLLF